MSLTCCDNPLDVVSEKGGIYRCRVCGTTYEIETHKAHKKEMPQWVSELEGKLAILLVAMFFLWLCLTLSPWLR